jgi:hypothetical protein
MPRPHRYHQRHRPRPRLTPESLQHWAFAIMIALLFISCGVEQVLDLYERLTKTPEPKPLESK